MIFQRNSKGFTLPFALILTFIFTFLVGVSYLFISINLNQLQNNLRAAQAIFLAEGINERTKARLNTKTLPTLSKEEEEKLKDSELSEDDELDEELFEDDEFDEDTELFSEYYADEIVKISRYITFRNPPEEEQNNSLIPSPQSATPDPQANNKKEDDKFKKPEANVRTVGDIEIPQGTILEKGTMIVVFKDEKLELKQEDILVTGQKVFKDKLPFPKIKTLSPNYGEVNSMSNFTVLGENIKYSESAHFGNKEVEITDIKSGPTIELSIPKEIKTGLTRFFYDGAESEYYIIPPYEGDPNPVIDNIKTGDDNQFLEIRTGQRNVVLMIYGADLFQNKNKPVLVPSACGIITKIKDESLSNKELTVLISIDKDIEVGNYSVFIATEGGFSNSWVFNVLPKEEDDKALSPSTATYTTSLTLLNVNAVENLLPLIDDDTQTQDPNDPSRPQNANTANNQNNNQQQSNPNDPYDPNNPNQEPSEKDKLGPFANTDLETKWILETEVMIGNVTRTISEIVERRIPKINAALTTNGTIVFNGGSFKLIGATNSMTILVEPTYISNLTLKVPGPPKEEDLDNQNIDPTQLQNNVPGQNPNQQAGIPQQPTQSPVELGFTEGSFLTVYMAGSEIEMLDYAVISNVGDDFIDLVPPGLMDFHYQNEDIYQFIPPTISSEEIQKQDAELHLVPKDFGLTIPRAVKFKEIFGASIDQLSDLADLYTNDPSIPKDDLELPVGFMGLTYIDGTPMFNEDNNLIGKGLLVIDTRGDNLGTANGTVEISGDSRSPAEFTGVVYVNGNLKIGGNLTINGALIVDNSSYGQVDISSSALGMITYDERAIKQTILSIPFTTKPGTIMISNKGLELGDFVLSGKKQKEKTGSSEFKSVEETTDTTSTTPQEAENSLIEEPKPEKGNSIGEEELIKFFE